jgi:ABC-2 type transport system permease protein
LTQSTTGSLATLVGVTLLVPAIAPGLPGIGGWFASNWPITAGQAVYAVVPVKGMIGPWFGFGILAAATTLIFAVGAISLHGRDI